MARTKKRQADPSSVVAYLRVSTEEQADSGLGLSAQRASIQAAAVARGWTIVAWHEDAGVSGKSLNRPGVTAALADVEEGRGGALVVSRVDRLSRSLVDFAGLMERARTGRWGLVALDLGVDTTTADGELMAHVVATFAQYERRLIGQRTKVALAEKKAQGVQLGRPVLMPADVVARIVTDHDGGQGWTAIARDLNAEGIPTAHGGARWYPSTVRYAYMLATAEAT